MYEMAKKAREAMKSKARRLAGEKDIKTDSSTWSPAPLLRSDIKTGARPIMKPSAKGIGESNAARDTKAAIGDAKRGAFKSGGAVKKDGGILDKKAVGDVEVMPKRGAAQHYKKGGRIKKLSGGKLMDYIKGASDSMHDLAYEDPEMDAIHNEGMVGHKLENRNWGIKTAVDKLKGKYGASAKKSGGRIKKAGGGSDDPSYVGASSVTKGGKPVTRPKDLETKSQREPDVSDLYTPDQAKRLEQGYKKGGKAKNWIAGAIKKPGALRKSLGVKEGENIPAKKLAKAAEAPGKLGQRARLAQTLKKLGKKRGGSVGLTVVIADKGGRAAPQGMTAPIQPRAVPVPMGAQGSMAPPPMMPPGAVGGAPPAVPMRKSGGRITKVASSYKDMEAGAVSGEGRLQKTDIAKKRKGAPTA